MSCPQGIPRPIMAYSFPAHNSSQEDHTYFYTPTHTQMADERNVWSFTSAPLFYDPYGASCNGPGTAGLTAYDHHFGTYSPMVAPSSTTLTPDLRTMHVADWGHSPQFYAPSPIGIAPLQKYSNNIPWTDEQLISSGSATWQTAYSSESSSNSSHGGSDEASPSPSLTSPMSFSSHHVSEHVPTPHHHREALDMGVNPSETLNHVANHYIIPEQSIVSSPQENSHLQSLTSPTPQADNHVRDIPASPVAFAAAIHSPQVPQAPMTATTNRTNNEPGRSSHTSADRQRSNTRDATSANTNTRTSRAPTRSNIPRRHQHVRARGKLPDLQPSAPPKAKFSGFECPLTPYGCQATFATKNEWKRHFMSQHLCLGFYRCELCEDPDNRPNDFNRKDLFSQHLKRMHKDILCFDNNNAITTPHTPTGEHAHTYHTLTSLHDNETTSFPFSGLSTADMHTRCYIPTHTPPQRNICVLCNESFAGLDSCREWLEHLGKHFWGKTKRAQRLGKTDKNGKASLQNIPWEEDTVLREWLVDAHVIVPSGKGEGAGGWVLATERAGVEARAKAFAKRYRSSGAGGRRGMGRL